ncbi:predicted protein [Streptomyces viridosporus ATCC 14672]|uniref:Predicted protein n=1 Tax=Streptomyces viridosporus (strain ATCC 14672 / DSM 40746 / JCM 4963 / KCTC 9882 / NRRL B-12104 / FH 1290) TaxID=566461 RepID=D5ZVH6_STRV1|nr:predicted protein [Streptomyces viridosporus ATCC 14672]
MSRLARVLDAHTPSRTATGFVSPPTVIVSLWSPGTGHSLPQTVGGTSVQALLEAYAGGQLMACHALGNGMNE